MKVSLVNFMELRKVIETGADIPEAPCKIPPIKPKGKNRNFDLSIIKCQFGANNLKVI